MNKVKAKIYNQTQLTKRCMKKKDLVCSCSHSEKMPKWTTTTERNLFEKLFRRYSLHSQNDWPWDHTENIWQNCGPRFHSVNVDQMEKVTFKTYRKPSDTGNLSNYYSCAPIHHKKYQVEKTLNKQFRCTTFVQKFCVFFTIQLRKLDENCLFRKMFGNDCIENTGRQLRRKIELSSEPQKNTQKASKFLLGWILKYCLAHEITCSEWKFTSVGQTCRKLTKRINNCQHLHSFVG